jgi:hypothetical protein
MADDLLALRSLAARRRGRAPGRLGVAHGSKWRPQLRYHLIDRSEGILNARQTAGKLGAVNVDGFETADADHVPVSGEPAVSCAGMNSARAAGDVEQRCHLHCFDCACEKKAAGPP